MDFSNGKVNGGDELKMINKSLKRRNIRLIAASAAVVFVLIILFNVALKPLLNNLYYNPLKSTYSFENTDMGISLENLIRLHSPDNKFGGIDAKNIGIGNYDLNIHYYDPLTSEDNNIKGNMNKGKLKTSEVLFNTPFPTNFAYGRSTSTSLEVIENNYPKTLSYLKDLPGYVAVKAYVSFSKDISMDELERLYHKYSKEGLYFHWAGVRSSSEEIQPYPLIGFDFYGSVNTYDNLNSHYDYFDLWKGLVDNQTSLAKAYEGHFKALINYQLDHLNFFKTMDDKIDYEAYYKDVLNYVENNGVKSYGIVVMGTGEEILKLSEEANIINIVVDDLTLSTDNKNY